MWCFHHRHNDSVYGEFIRTFEFGSSVSLPIVQPGGFVPFPDPTVRPSCVKPVSFSINDGAEFVGLSVPAGVYRVRWALNPSQGAEVSLLVNNEPATSRDKYQYGKQIKDSREPIRGDYLVVANGGDHNLISLVNSGATLFTLSELPNTRIGDKYLLTQIQVERISDL